jgi:hypothetical protein
MSNNSESLKDNQKEITLKLTYAEINTIISCLSKKPFDEVYSLIGKIHTQSSSQINQ